MQVTHVMNWKDKLSLLALFCTVSAHLWSQKMKNKNLEELLTREDFKMYKTTQLSRVYNIYIVTINLRKAVAKAVVVNTQLMIDDESKSMTRESMIGMSGAEVILV